MSTKTVRILQTYLKSPLSASATTIVVKLFLDSTGVQATMAGFGDFGVVCLKSGDQVEMIKFTNITANADTTSTLTVATLGRNLSPIYPHTGSATGLNWSAGTSVIVSDDPLTLNSSARPDSTNTWSAIQTYTVLPQSSATPTSALDFTTKAYVDSLLSGGSPNATTAAKGIIQLAVQSQVDARTTVGSTGASLVATLDLIRSSKLSDYVADTSVTANTYTIAPTPAISAYTDGQRFIFKALQANTTSATLAVSALTATAIKRPDGSDVIIGDILAGSVIEVVYIGGVFQIVSNFGVQRVSTAATYTPGAASTATLLVGNAGEHRITMPAGNVILAVAGDAAAMKFLVSITQDSVGSRLVTWFATIRWAGGTVPALTTTANKRDIFGFIRTGASTYDGFIVGLNI